MQLVHALKPQLLVELGTHRGASYCAFCQAVAESGLATRCFAVDTWRGDRHTGEYGEEIYAELCQYHDPEYGGFSTLLRDTFDHAAPLFMPGSIDLLHIDGCHAYDAVRHDFDTWLPKMSPRGIVLLHDISVTEDDFGVRQLWGELADDYRTVSFRHSYGLGVLAVGEPGAQALPWLFDCSPGELDLTQELFKQLGHRIELQVENSRLEARIETTELRVQKLESELRARYELERHPVIRILSASKRYGVRGALNRAVERARPRLPGKS
jgi:hypothetical protein